MKIAIDIAQVVSLGKRAVIQVLYAGEKSGLQFGPVIAVLHVHRLDVAVKAVVVKAEFIVQPRAHKRRILGNKRNVIVRICNADTAQCGNVR